MEALKSKAASATRYLAELLLDVDRGQRIPTTSDLAAQLTVGFGTVEKALAALRDEAIITVRARGQMGTFLLERDLKRQWKAAGLGTIIGLLPLPNATPFIGLATGLTAWFETTGVPFAINFKNGARTRLMALAEARADLVALSKRSAETICAESDDFVVVLELPPQSYYVGHEIIFRRDHAVARGEWRIGVDSTSLDHVEFCAAVFPSASVKEIHYLNLPYAIAKGEIDASVVHSRSLVPLEFATVLDSRPVEVASTLFDSASAGVFLARRDNRALRAIFREVGGTDAIFETQRAVMNRQQVPQF